MQLERQSPSVELSEEHWRIVYESINALLYGLGPFELFTLKGMELHEVCNLNLKICSHVWGAYGGCKWESPIRRGS